MEKICDDFYLSLLLNPTFSVFPRVISSVTWRMKSARHLEWCRFTSGKIPIDLERLDRTFFLTKPTTYH